MYKRVVVDLIVDIVGSFLIAIGVYNFAAASDFPFSGISGIALIFYHLFEIPIGTMTILLNIPIILICGRWLSKAFLIRSLKTMVISTFFMDVIAPCFPVYEGDLMLSAISLGLLSGLGYAMIYMRDTSTGGMDFVIMAIRKMNPHLTLGRIIAILDCSVTFVGGLVMDGDIDKIIYGLLASYVLSVVVDKVMYGINAGKLTLVVTEHGHEIAEKIDVLTNRGCTILHGIGGYSKEDKHIVMCACSRKQMPTVQKVVKEIDDKAFLVIMEAGEVRGNGFTPH